MRQSLRSLIMLALASVLLCYYGTRVAWRRMRCAASGHRDLMETFGGGGIQCGYCGKRKEIRHE